MPKLTLSNINSKAAGTLSLGTDTDQSLIVDPWMVDTSGVTHLAAVGASSYDTTISRTGAGVVSVNGMPLGPGAGAAGAGATVTGVSAETLLLSGVTIPAGALKAGQAWRLVAQGTLTTTVDTQTVDFKFRWGGLTGTQLMDFGAQNPDSGGTLTGARWRWEADIVATSATELSVSAVDALNFFFSSVSGAETAVTNTAAEQFVLTVTPSSTAETVVCTSFHMERVV